MVEGKQPMMSNVWIAFIVNAGVAVVAYRAKSVTASGAVSGFFIGSWIYAFSGLKGFLVLAFFFVSASLFTRFGYVVKQQRGSAQKKEGRRTVREGLANCLVGMVLSTLYFFTGELFYGIGLVASFATALADTTATELGSLYGKSPVLLPFMKPVPPGTPGAVSWEGTFWGIVAAGLLGLFAVKFSWMYWQALPCVLVGASVGFLGESFLVRFPFPIHHDVRNFLNTLVGAGVAMWLALWVY